MGRGFYGAFKQGGKHEKSRSRSRQRGEMLGLPYF